MLFLLTASTQKLKLEKIHGALIVLFYVIPSFPPLRYSFKENAGTFSKSSTTQEGNIKISRLKEDCKTYAKQTPKPKNKPIMEKLHDELYQLGNKQAKDAKLGANIR